MPFKKEISETDTEKVVGGLLHDENGNVIKCHAEGCTRDAYTLGADGKYYCLRHASAEQPSCDENGATVPTAPQITPEPEEVSNPGGPHPFGIT